MLNFLITSFQRPAMLRACLASIEAQDEDRWQVFLADDGSDDETRQVIFEWGIKFADRFTEYRVPPVSPQERPLKVRFSVNINRMLNAYPLEGLVMYLCDDVEVDDELTRVAHEYFEAHPDVNAGYVGQVLAPVDWQTNTSLGYAELRMTGNEPVTDPLYRLDHSQVIHRATFKPRWVEDAQYWHEADGHAFRDLVKQAGAIQPIDYPRAYVLYKITDTSICRQPVEQALEKLQHGTSAEPAFR